VFRAIGPNAKLICRCDCVKRDEKGVIEWAAVHTHEDQADCGTLNKTNCLDSEGSGKLEGCERWSVPLTGREELVWPDRPLVVE
jgi:hypothetical protein